MHHIVASQRDVRPLLPMHRRSTTSCWTWPRPPNKHPRAPSVRPAIALSEASFRAQYAGQSAPHGKAANCPNGCHKSTGDTWASTEIFHHRLPVGARAGERFDLRVDCLDTSVDCCELHHPVGYHQQNMMRQIRGAVCRRSDHFNLNHVAASSDPVAAFLQQTWRLIKEARPFSHQPLTSAIKGLRIERPFRSKRAEGHHRAGRHLACRVRRTVIFLIDMNLGPDIKRLRRSGFMPVLKAKSKR